MSRFKPIQLDTSEIKRYIDAGAHQKKWYQQNEIVLASLFGRERLVTIANIFAATSINSSLKSNVRLFIRAFHELENGLPFGAYLPNIKMQLERIRRGEDLSGREIRSFARAMSGGTQAVVVDVWLLRAFGIDNKYLRNSGPHAGHMRSGGATERQYDYVEEWVRNEAYQMGIEPRELSAMIWAGIRIVRAGDYQSTYIHLISDYYVNLFQDKHPSRKFLIP